MDYISIIGYLAASFTTFSSLPQLIKIIKTKQVRDVSIIMFSMMGLGIILWFIYGIYKNDMPIIIANIISFVLILTIIILKLKYRKRNL